MFLWEHAGLGLMILFCLSWKDGQRAGVRKTLSANRNQFACDQTPSRQLSAATSAIVSTEGERNRRHLEKLRREVAHRVRRKDLQLFHVASRARLIKVAI